MSLFAAVALNLVSTELSARGAAQDSTPIWSIVPSERVSDARYSSPSGRFLDVDAISTNDVWAVGDRQPGYQLIEHWDGRLWRVVEVPSPGYGYLSGVSGASRDDVWAVGAGSFDPVVVEHWNGATWERSRTPETGYEVSWLGAVTALGPDDVWAVGAAYGDAGGVPLVEHWNGRRWRIVPTPGEPENYVVEVLDGVSAVSPSDIWAVGVSREKGHRVTVPLSLHWDGSTWSRVPIPRSGRGGELVEDVAMASSTDGWAVGQRLFSVNGREPIFKHWDGTEWSVVDGPTPGEESWLSAVLTLSGSDVWAVGSRWVPDVGLRTMVQHWNGQRWRIVPSADPVGPGGQEVGAELAGLAALDTGELWAVGSQFPYEQMTLIERYGIPFCSDRIDNDGDGATDYPVDQGCGSSIDGSEFSMRACENGYENDHDGLIDWPQDPGCSGPSDRSEHGTIQCDDGIDNDLDGRKDYRTEGGGDHQCTSPSDPDELT